jgi:LPS export ABC transporter protein LptC
MNSWQARARAGVAIFGVVVAATVFFAMRDRETAAPPAAVRRSDPKAVAEAIGGALERFNRAEKNFRVTSGRIRHYDDGSVKYIDGVTITVEKGEGRTFTVSSREATAGKDQIDLALTGDVKLQDSDGFSLSTDLGTFNQKTTIASAPGAVVFGKGRMSGSGTGIRYDQPRDLLVISSEARIRTTDEAGNTTMEFAAGTAALDRITHRLMLDTSVRVVRGEQVIEADHAEAHLSEDDQIVRFIALRGNSRVVGGGSSIDAMSARDIDLDYTDDGTRLEAVLLNGNGAVAMKGESGGGDRQIVSELIDLKLADDGSSRMVLTGKASITTAAAAGRSGRTIASDALEIELAPDGSLTRAVGRENVRLDLPAAPGEPVRSIRTRLLDGRGTAGKGLTSATFTGAVEFTEQVAKAAAPRTARAQKLETVMNGDVVTTATFTGDVTFEETGLKACAERLDYQPEKGTLALSGATAAGIPIVAEEQVNIEADTIDVALEGRGIVGKGSVTTRTGSGTRCKPSSERAAAQRPTTRLPAMLDQKAQITISGERLDYEGGAGKAVYSGRALLTQGPTTSIRAEKLTLDQMKGDLTATGSANAIMTLDGRESSGRAHEIRYVDAQRLITYAAPPAGYVAPPVRPGGNVVAPTPQLTLPQGTITAGSRIEMKLAKEGSKLEGLDARTNVTMLQKTEQGSRTATGGARLTYDPGKQQFEMTAGTGSTLVKIVDRSSPPSCREYSGRVVTFFESGDRIIIDGEDKNRTGIAPSACAPAAR